MSANTSREIRVVGYKQVCLRRCRKSFSISFIVIFILLQKWAWSFNYRVFSFPSFFCLLHLCPKIKSVISQTVRVYCICIEEQTATVTADYTQNLLRATRCQGAARGLHM